MKDNHPLTQVIVGKNMGVKFPEGFTPGAETEVGSAYFFGRYKLVRDMIILASRGFFSANNALEEIAAVENLSDKSLKFTLPEKLISEYDIREGDALKVEQRKYGFVFNFADFVGRKFVPQMIPTLKDDYEKRE